MDGTGDDPPVRVWTVWLALALALVVTLALATVFSLGAGFGVMTSCTNDFSCTTTGCAPCATARRWLSGGWALQGIFVALTVLGMVLAVRRVQLRAVRLAAYLIAAAAVVVFVGTTAAALASF